MIDPSDNKQHQEDIAELSNSLQNAARALLSKIKKKVEDVAKEVPIPDKTVTIKVGRNVAYKGVLGQQNDERKLNFDNVDAINLAFDSPQDMKKEVSIKLGNETIFQTEKGKVKIDKLDLSNPKPIAKSETQNQVQDISQTLDNIQKQLQQQQQAIDNLSNSNPEKVKELTEQVSGLKQMLEQQQQTINLMNQKLSDVMDRNLPTVRDPNLSNWSTKAELKFKQAAMSVWKNLSKLESKLGSGLQFCKDVAAKLQSKIQSAVSQVATTANNFFAEYKGKEIEKSVGYLLDKFGQTQSDGSKIFESKNYVFEHRNGVASIQNKNGNTVFSNGSISSTATEQDLATLDQVTQTADEHKQSQTQSQSQSQSRGRSR